MRKISIILYGVSLFTPIFIGNWDIGLVALMMGWMGVLSMDMFFAFPWIANLTYFACLIVDRSKKRIRIALNVLTIVLGLFAIGITEAPKIEGNEDVFVGVGFIIWLASFIMLLLYNLNLKNEIQLD
jgi:hypothetical protein